MKLKEVIFLLIIINCTYVTAFVQLDRDVNNPAFDQSLYEDVLDTIQCEQQISYMTQNNMLLQMQFLDAGLRVPRSILMGNVLDLGNYHQCLGIHEEIETTTIQGKYCTINIPLSQSEDLLELLPSNNIGAVKTEWQTVQKEIMDNLQLHYAYKASMAALERSIKAFNGKTIRSLPEGWDDIELTLAVCLPKPCTTQVGISGLLFNATGISFEYNENFCRLANDKPWVPADYVAIIIFSILGLLTLLSTSYDIYCTIILSKDSKSISVIGRSFSLYTNARRLKTFVSNADSLECIDGIRALAMTWVIFGHTFLTLPPIINNLDVFDALQSSSTIWITAAPITVDTFFVLSGLLLVYTTAGKLTRMKLLKNLHLFYLNRILRLFPLLGAAILFQASFFHHISDGPLWNSVAMETNNCRLNWWINLLYLQNYISTNTMCIGPTWYLAVDMQLYILSPILLFWVLSDKKKTVWIALTSGLLVSICGTTIYSFIMEFPGSSLAVARQDESIYYSQYYYINTFTRIPVFIVGMIYGYLLHLWRGNKLKISKLVIAVSWICAIALIVAGLISSEPMKNPDWDNQTVDSLINSFIRPAWALGVGWIVFACVHGYGGPVNWFLSLYIWKLLSRVSYAMYLFHYPIMFVMSGSTLAPIYITETTGTYRFLTQFTLVFIVGYVMTLFIDSPFSTIFKILFGGGAKKLGKEKTVSTVPKSAKEGIVNETFHDTESPPEGNKNVTEEENKL